jgi:hypothetical protein
VFGLRTMVVELMYKGMDVLFITWLAFRRSKNVVQLRRRCKIMKGTIRPTDYTGQQFDQVFNMPSRFNNVLSKPLIYIPRALYRLTI